MASAMALYPIAFGVQMIAGEIAFAELRRMIRIAHGGLKIEDSIKSSTGTNPSASFEGLSRSLPDATHRQHQRHPDVSRQS